MSQSPRAMLRKSIQRILIPKFVEFGFELHPYFDDASREQRVRNPFGILRRKVPKGIEQIEVNLGEPPRDNFMIRFGLVPSEGMTFWGFVDPEERVYYPSELLRVDWAPESLELCTSTLRSVFNTVWSIWHWPWRRVTQEDQDKLVSKASAMAPELNDYFLHGTIGPHVRISLVKHLKSGIGDLRFVKPAPTSM